ncbi:MAG: hypothetical protein M0T77_03160 [Actinomycetota bacterium]|nr:hypothetical protein [Actinomycetota bacterium]
MVDPRIYRGFMAVVAFAVIVFGFSLAPRPHALTARLPPGTFFSGIQSAEHALAKRFPDPVPGSAADRGLAAYVAHDLAGVAGRAGNGGFSVQTGTFTAQTPSGPRVTENVVATRPGLGSGGAIVVISDRSASGSQAASGLYSTAVLLSLAQALSTQTLNRSVTLVSTSGQNGLAGATRLAASLAGQPVDAVIALGNLTGSVVHSPVVVPWSSTDRRAPALLDGTLAAAVASQAHIRNAGSGLAGQVARMAFPFAVTEQAPFAAQGLPAALLSLTGDSPASGSAASGPAGRPAALGSAVLEAVDALDRGPAVGHPGSYLELSGQLVPLWAIRLLALALILPVLAVTVDAVARARRRGHALARWLAWVLAGVAPFLLGLAVLLIARAAGALSFLPVGAVAGPGVSPTGDDVAVMVVVVAAVVIGFVLLRPLLLRALARWLPDGSRRPQTPAADAAAVALSAVQCVLALAVWLVNPFAALLLAPALHLWIWLAQPSVRGHRWSLALLLLIGVAPGVLIVFYYANAYGLSPLQLAWSLTLLPGGAMSPATALYWSAELGCVASAVIISARALRMAAAAAQAPVTVRGPVSYAGPGSLGGTESALRR